MIIKIKPFTPDRGGILLIEILLIIVVLSVSLTMIVQSLAASVKAAALCGDYTRALWALDNIMFDLAARKDDDTAVDKSGSVPDLTEKFEYRIEETRPLPITGPDLTGVRELSVTVLWPSGHSQLSGHTQRRLTAVTWLTRGLTPVGE